MRNSWPLIILLFIFLVISFVTLPYNPLLNDDAALYALAVKNAIGANQWLAQFITPGDPQSFLDKPPLGIWLLAAPLKICALHVNELTIHIPNLIYYTILLLLLYFYLPKKLGLLTAVIAATSLALVVYARTPKLDLLLTLFSTLSLLSLYRLLKEEKIIFLYLAAFSTAGAGLIKSGFGLIIPGTSIIGLLLLVPEFRQKARRYLFSYHLWLSLLLSTAAVGGILLWQKTALEGEWLNYLRSFTIQSKYNVSYLGFGWHYSIIGLLLITLFPWTPLFLVDIFKIKRALTLRTFCLIWAWSNFLFLFFFYNQTDFRTFTFFVPPLAILAAQKLLALKRFRLGLSLWNLFFLLVFTAATVMLIIKPYNPDGFYLGGAILPLALFTLSLLSLSIFYLRPARLLFIFSLALVMAAYSLLFYNTKPIADAFNPDVSWPTLIDKQVSTGKSFVIYRPRDRNLFFSPDLFYIDFMAGPADFYFWEPQKLKDFLTRHDAVVLSDSKSWGKLNLLHWRVLAKDNYSQLMISGK